MSEVIKSYKGFNKDMTCRGFQYEEGKEYEESNALVCENGFHTCEYPLDCLGYYSPSESVYHEVEQSGKLSKESDDTKVASTKIKIGAKLSIARLVEAAIEYTKKRVKPEADSDDYKGASSATGDYGASSAESPNAVAVAWGYKGKAKGVKGSFLVLPDGSAIVICEYKQYVAWKERYTDENPESTYTKSYLLEPGYHHLHDCETNETALVKKLMEVQKR